MKNQENLCWSSNNRGNNLSQSIITLVKASLSTNLFKQQCETELDAAAKNSMGHLDL